MKRAPASTFVPSQAWHSRTGFPFARAVVAALAAVLGLLAACRPETPLETPPPVKSAPVSDRIALLAGASGETIEPNFFIEDFKDLQQALAARGWKTSVVAGARDGLLPGSLKATNKNLMAGVKQALEQTITGGQALLVFHSHGREKETYWGQRSHSIVSEDKDASGSDPGFDLDSIEPELIKAKARGVRVGLVDLSCYSGSTQALRGAACKVSLASPRYVSLCSGRKEERFFNSVFFKLPAPGVLTDLETQFLDARRQDRISINLPQISSRETPALEGWDSFLVKADPLDTYEDLKNLATGTPSFDRKLLLGDLDKWIARRPANPRVAVLRKVIERKLDVALAFRKQLEKEMPALAKDYDEPSVTVEVPDRGPLKLGPGYLFEALKAIRDATVPDGYTDSQRGFLTALGPQRASLETRYAAPLQAFEGRREDFDGASEAFEQAAVSLFDSERELYDLQPDLPGANPCKEFTL